MSDQSPPSVQSTLGSSGAPASFEWRGKTWNVGHPDQASKARLEELIAQAETQAVQALKPATSPEEYRELLMDLGRQLRSREQRTRDGSLWLRYMAGPELGTGIVLWALSLIRGPHPEFTEADLRAAFDESGDLLTLAIDRVVPGFFDYLGTALSLPPETLAGLQAEAQRIFAALRPKR